MTPATSATLGPPSGSGVGGPAGQPGGAALEAAGVMGSMGRASSRVADAAQQVVLANVVMANTPTSEWLAVRACRGGGCGRLGWRQGGTRERCAGDGSTPTVSGSLLAGGGLGGGKGRVWAAGHSSPPRRRQADRCRRVVVPRVRVAGAELTGLGGHLVIGQLRKPHSDSPPLLLGALLPLRGRGEGDRTADSPPLLLGALPPLGGGWAVCLAAAMQGAKHMTLNGRAGRPRTSGGREGVRAQALDVSP